MSLVECFVETSNHPGDSVSLQPRFAALQLVAFPKTKITLEREEISDVNEIQKNTTGQLMAIGRTVWDPKVPIFKGTEVSLPRVQCFWHLVISSVNISISYYMTGYFLDRPGLVALDNWCEIFSLKTEYKLRRLKVHNNLNFLCPVKINNLYESDFY